MLCQWKLPWRYCTIVRSNAKSTHLDIIDVDGDDIIGPSAAAIFVGIVVVVVVVVVVDDWLDVIFV